MEGLGGLGMLPGRTEHPRMRLDPVQPIRLMCVDENDDRTMLAAVAQFSDLLDNFLGGFHQIPQRGVQPYSINLNQVLEVARKDRLGPEKSTETDVETASSANLEGAKNLVLEPSARKRNCERGCQIGDDKSKRSIVS